MILPGVIASSGGVASSFESIATYTVASGGVANFSFTSISQSYSHLQMRILVGSTTGDSFWLQFNSDTAGNYAFHRLMGNGTAASAGASTSNTVIAIGSGTGFPSATSTYGAAVIDIFDYTSTNKNKTLRSLSGFDANGTGGISLDSGLWFATPAAISTIKVTSASGSLRQFSSFALYGVKA